ncbi:serine-rich adhesin for platelets isoform X1 [Patella vulgata]|uniref:serine-rich adhesin for platelets isoform X1 n=1 Tax=Patella vulgata TaxID=6465 RepID=UPI0024A8D37F|nr:serine-rich adhesin for platelets isoform X1 [Patella vulgata]XP_050394126.2 serine-rich adhesin for platelets isoform X1 [Patella vulgata]XP_050394127.2 serine-rich adhesin for platelets isoform X1 [Patella vulgata]
MVLLLVIISLVVSFTLIFVLLGCFQCFAGNKSKGFSTFENPTEEAIASQGFENEGISLEPSDLVTVDSSGFTSVTIEPLPDILSKTVSTSALRPRIRCIEKSKQESALRLITVHHPFPRAQLTYLKEIGSSWFGQVIETDAEKILSGVARNRVIVKVLKDGASTVEQKQFLEDVAPYRELDHINIIRLLGQCTETTPLLLVLEFAPLGDLKAYLRNHKTDSATFIQKNLQLRFALDVASGLACLHRHSYLHQDLASRTCLVAGDQTIKIGDYGTSEERYKSDYYNNGQELLPIRWMAPESLELQDVNWQITEITKECNIWSYGVLLWEIMAYGEMPYTALPNEQVLDGVIKQKLIKLLSPVSTLPYRDRMFEVMQFCWLKPEQRPTIEEVHGLLQKLYEQTTSTQSQVTIDEFEQKWDTLIPKEIHVQRPDNIAAVPSVPKEFESNFLASSENVNDTTTGLAINNADKLSNNGDFDLSLPSDGFMKPDSMATPCKPIRQHLTSTPMTKDNFRVEKPNADLQLQTKPETDFETMFKDEGISPMNDSAVEEDAFESPQKADGKPKTTTIEEDRQADALVTSAETVTSGVVTGDFSLSGKHFEQMTQSASLSTIPSQKSDEIHFETKEKNSTQKPDIDSFDHIDAVIVPTENETSETNFSQTENRDHSLPETTTTNSGNTETVEIIPDIESPSKSVFPNDNETQFSDPMADFVNISNNNNLMVAPQNPPNTVIINSALAADIDEFMNASFDSPMNVSDDKSADNLTDFSDLDAIFNGKTSSDLSSSNEALEESNQIVDQKSDISKTTSVDDATEQVGNFVNNKRNVFPNLNEKQRLELCEINSSTPVNNFNRYSRAKEYFNKEQSDISLVNGACSPVVNGSEEESSTQSDDTDESTTSSGSSYICDYNVTNVDSNESKGVSSDTKTVVKTEDTDSESESNTDTDDDGSVVFSMNEDEIRIAEELYLSKGVNSPSVYEKTPLETIPEDDLPTPKELESFDIKFEGQFDEVFTSQDNFEWDDFMGESLVGRPRSSDISPKRALDFSDWMVEDDISLRSNSSALSNSKNTNGVRGSAGSLDSPSVRSSISESEVKRSQPRTKPRSYISELITNRSFGSLTSNYRNHASSFYSLYDNMDEDDSTSDEQYLTDLNLSNHSHNIQLGNSYIGHMHDIKSKSNLPAANGTNKVFGATMTTDLDEDLPDYDMLTDSNESQSKNEEDTVVTSPAENMLHLNR